MNPVLANIKLFFLQVGQIPLIQVASFRNTSRSLRQCGQGIVTSNVLELRGVSSMAFIRHTSYKPLSVILIFSEKW